jgi:hypothetical protein
MEKTEIQKRVDTGRLVIIILLVQLAFLTLFIILGSVNTTGYVIEAWHVIIFNICFIFVIMFITLFGGHT